MQRTKVFAVSAALVSAALAAVLLTGGASAASWHTYDGDMFAGHAYGLQVPPGADSIEFLFEGADAGSASIGVYAPDGDKVGFYELAPTLTAASVANPGAGRYVVYVYDVTQGALSVRVSAKDAPDALDLREVELVRQEMKIGTFEQGKLDQVITAELKEETVFVTLLYQGSSNDLDATVRSAKGAVVTITDESATAFSPGVWTSLKGVRVFDAANLEGTKYDVEVHAAQFEGTMTLTTLSLKMEMPTPIAPPAQPRHPAHPAPDVPAAAPRVEFDPAGAHFALQEGIPVAFEALGTSLTLALPLDEDEACEDNESHHDYACGVGRAIVAIYTPEDEVLAVVELSDDEPAATVELAVKGEYVAYARYIDGEAVLARIDGVTDAPAIRTLATEVEVVTIDDLSGMRDRTSSPLELTYTPLELSLRFVDGVGTLSSLDLSNEKGSVASSSALAVIPGADMFQWAYVEPANFAAGAHTLSIFGLYEGSAELTSVHYLRDTTVTAEEIAHEHEKHDDHDTPSGPVPYVPELPRIFDALPRIWP